MFFIILTFFAAILIEGLGTLVSVIGLSTLFGANPIVIALAISLDIGKIVVVSLLYKYWANLNMVMRTYALVAATFLMIITSAGAGGYLSGEFQKAIIGTQEGSLKVEVLKTEQAKLEERKKQIDAGIAAIPDRYSANQKIRLINQFKEEQKTVTARLREIDKQLPETQIQQIGVEAKAGPILYIAKAFNISVEEAVKWVILMIIIVFDPLAVFLIVAGNFLLEQRQLKKEIAAESSDPSPPPVDPPSPPSDPVTEPVAVKNIASTEAATETKQMLRPARPSGHLSWPDALAPQPVKPFDPPEIKMAPQVTPQPKVDDSQRHRRLYDEPVTPEIEEPVVSIDPPESKMTPWEALQFIAEEDQRLGLYGAPVPPTVEEPVSPPAEEQTSGQPREQITLSSLGFIKEDPNTLTGDHDHPNPREVGIGTGVYRS
jgi:hypothetical protein